MVVVPEVLRAFAGQTDTAAGAITGAGLGNKVSTWADVLAGHFDGRS
jgi:hypothetical protein